MKKSHPVQALLANPDTFTTVLMAIVLEHYGTEALDWTPETIFMELRDDFHVEIPQPNKDQIVVGINLLTSDDFYQRPSRFIQICNVLCGADFSLSFDKADASECAWGITEATLLAPPDNPKTAFHPEVLNYLGAVLDEEGIKNPPAILAIALRDTEWEDLSDLESIPTEDPDFFAASFQNREDKTKVIEQELSKNFSQLLSQLGSVPELEESVQGLTNDLR